jgi:hypothetical protein
VHRRAATTLPRRCSAYPVHLLRGPQSVPSAARNCCRARPLPLPNRVDRPHAQSARDCTETKRASCEGPGRPGGPATDRMAREWPRRLVSRGLKGCTTPFRLLPLAPVPSLCHPFPPPRRPFAHFDHHFLFFSDMLQLGSGPHASWAAAKGRGGPGLAVPPSLPPFFSPHPSQPDLRAASVPRELPLLLSPSPSPPTHHALGGSTTFSPSTNVSPGPVLQPSPLLLLLPRHSLLAHTHTHKHTAAARLSSPRPGPPLLLLLVVPGLWGGASEGRLSLLSAPRRHACHGTATQRNPQTTRGFDPTTYDHRHATRHDHT